MPSASSAVARAGVAVVEHQQRTHAGSFSRLASSDDRTDGYVEHPGDDLEDVVAVGRRANSNIHAVGVVRYQVGRAWRANRSPTADARDRDHPHRREDRRDLGQGRSRPTNEVTLNGRFVR
jgi:hypothetical protein